MPTRSLLKEFVKEHLLEQTRKHFEMQLPDDLKAIASVFKRYNHPLYVVGGAVRDAIQGKEPKDYDVATDATPDQVAKILQSISDLKIIPVGESFGVIKTLTPAGNEYEIATFRKDIGKGRRPDSVEYTDIENDVLRRDLTINALFYDIDKQEIVDFVGGINDIEKGIVRSVGNPKERFDEDRLRVLRVLRFAGRMGTDIDPATAQAIYDDNNLTGVSPERIRDEFIKGIKSSKGTMFLNLLGKFKMWTHIFPGLQVSEDAFGTTNVPVLIALLLDKNLPDATAKRLNALKYSADEVKKIQFLLSFKNLTPENAYQQKKNFAKSTLSDDDLLEYSELRSSPADALVSAFVAYQPQITGDSLLSKGFKGAALGKELERLETERFKELL